MNLFGAKCRKGNAGLDTIMIVVVIVIFAMVGIFGYQIFDELNTDVLDDLNHSAARNTSSDLHSKYPNLLDNLFLLAFVLFVVFAIVSVFLLDTHPIFFIISVVLLISVFCAALLLGNAYDDMMTDDELAPYANQFSYTSWVMSHIVELMIAVGFIILLALFIKFRAG